MTGRDSTVLDERPRPVPASRAVGADTEVTLLADQPDPTPMAATAATVLGLLTIVLLSIGMAVILP